MVRFFPVVRKALLDVPSLQRIAKTKKPADVVYPHDYLVAGFDAAANAGQVFLDGQPRRRRDKLGVEFSGQGDRSGGLVTPDLELSGVSRLTGPIVGRHRDRHGRERSTPSAWFGALTGAKLFGVLSLSDILDGVGFDELDKLPQLIGQALNQVEQLIVRA